VARSGTRCGPTGSHNVAQLGERAHQLARAARERIILLGAAGVTDEDAKLYEELVLYALYDHCRDPLAQLVEAGDVRAAATSTRTRKLATYDDFAAEYELLLKIPGLRLASAPEPAHLIALFFQTRRAFHFIYNSIVGRSLASAQLRARAWQSVFTHDTRRYMRALYDRMGDFTTLITGPSGTGKELVARAIGWSRYIPFDPKTKTFADDFAASFHPLNLSAPLADADRVGAVRPSARRVHRRAGRPGRLARDLPAAWDGLPRRDRRA